MGFTAKRMESRKCHIRQPLHTTHIFHDALIFWSFFLPAENCHWNIIVKTGALWQSNGTASVMKGQQLNGHCVFTKCTTSRQRTPYYEGKTISHSQASFEKSNITQIDKTSPLRFGSKPSPRWCDYIPNNSPKIFIPKLNNRHMRSFGT